MWQRFAALALLLSFAAPASATSGGDSTVEILGWDAAHSSIIVRRELGGESAAEELLAFNLETKRIDLASCECSSIDSPRTADEKAYAKAQKNFAHLSRLPELPQKEWAEAQISFGCTGENKLDENNRVYRREHCQLALGNATPTTFTFSAPSDWQLTRIFRAPGHTDTALAWVIHTGTLELGYRENELVVTPDFKTNRISVTEFVRRYLSP